MDTKAKVDPKGGGELQVLFNYLNTHKYIIKYQVQKNNMFKL